MTKMNPKKNEWQEAIMAAAYRNYGKGLTSRAFFKTNDRTNSEDLVQETFTKTWVYLVKGGRIEIMKAFLYHVLNYLIIDGYRKHKINSLEELIEKGHEPSIDTSHQLYNTLDGKAAALLIQRLPEKYKKIMNMRYIQLLSIKEIATITGQSRNVIAVQAYRGLEKLKRLYHSR